MSRSRKNRAAHMLAATPLRAAIERLGRWRGVLAFDYHRVGDSAGQPWDRALWSVSAEVLDEQLEIFARDTEVIEPADIHKTVRRGFGRRVLLTFDDGYRDNYEIAFPLLRRHGLPATFFLTTGFLDGSSLAWWDEIAWMVRSADRETLRLDDLGPDGWGWHGRSLAPAEHDARIAELIAHYKMLPAPEGEHLLQQIAQATGSGRCDAAAIEGLWMTWDMARELRAAGMSIGGHTATHTILARIPAARQRDEIDTCAKRLEEELHVPMRWFAYPVGSRDAFTSETQRILRERGVELAFSSYGGLGHPRRWNPFDVPRLAIDQRYDRQLLKATVSLPLIFARSMPRPRARGR